MGQKISIEHQAGTRKGEKESFTSKVIRAGRDPSCEIRFDVEKDLDASATHAEIRWSGAGFKILDLGSTNGTYLNGEKIVEGALSSGDEVRFGKDGPLIRISISRAHRPRAAVLAIGAALILIAGTVALLLWLPRSEDSPSHVEAPRGVPEGEAIVAIYSRAWYATKSSVEVIAEAWGTGVLIREDGVVLAPKHVVRPWKFQPEARAMVEHYKSRL
ncbi:MAG: FHA domain-containing protein, partial [Planctomycetota bacterium]|nr:FHA domain-containing protein [Planctomycetota bacterium]